MYKGIYIALSGSVLKHQQMEVISQNIANADTIGYKKDSVSFKDYLVSADAINNQDGRIMTTLATVKTDFSAGNIIKTGRALDIAVDGRGFIALEGNNYTRKGILKRDSEGYLALQNGMRVLGSNGPIKLSEGNIEIDEKGNISVRGVKVDSIRIVDFETEDLQRVGDGIFFTNANAIETDATIMQGYLETSNVNLIQEMVKMMEAWREFEAFQKVIQGFDEATSKVTNEMGRL